MKTSELDRFAEQLMRLVRDQAIEAAERFEPEAVRDAVPSIVDRVLFALLDAADTDFPLAWKCTDGTFVTLEQLGQGETAGWLMSSDDDSWRRRFSAKGITAETRPPD